MATSAAKKPATKRKTKPTTQASAHAQKQMWAVVLFALGLLLAALTLIEGARLWLWLHNLVLGVFGWSAFVLPPLIIYVAVIAALDKPLSTIGHKVWQVLVLIVFVSGAIQLFGQGMPEGENFMEAMPVLFNQGKALRGGGACAALSAWPLEALFDTAGARIILVLCIFVFTMLVTGSTLIGLFQTARKPVKGLGDAYAASLENRKQAAAKAPPITPEMPPRFAFDVDISADKPVTQETVPASPGYAVAEDSMPRHPVISERPPTSLARERLMDAITSPVERISPREFAAAPQEPPELVSTTEPVRRHALDEEILKAEEAEAAAADEIGDIVGRFLENIAQPEDSGGFDNGFGDIAGAEAPVTIQVEQEPPAIPREYVKPPLSLLGLARAASAEDISEELRTNAEKLVDTLKSFGVQTRILDICRGPAVTRYELQPSAGVKISKITGLSDDIALNLASAGIRIEAPIPNKAAVGIEVPNKTVSIVSIREIIDSPNFQNEPSNLTVALGKDIAGNIKTANLAGMPHMLIAGSTGSGKSVCINSIIISLLYKASPDKVKLLMVDPKVVELGVYNGIPHLLVPVVTDPKKAAGALNWAVVEMQRRYKAFAEQGVRNLAGYNQLAEESPDDEIKPMPQIVIIIDELADLMMAAPGEVEEAICRLAQLARAAGMHLVIATQRPSVDVITGVIKANIPSRVAFAVSSQVDSRTILDMGGAEKLLGRGDMLFYPMGEVKPLRVQGCFVADAEVERVVAHVKQNAAEYDQDIADEIDRRAVQEKSNGKKDKDDGGGFDAEDEMLPLAVECVVEAGQASTSLLQRRLKLGYARAARIVDQLEERGIVGPSEGSKPRQVLISKDRWLEMKLSGAESAQIKEFADA